jgi:hypothetical protein
VIDQNAAPSKIDWFLRRAVAYDIVVDPATGEATATVEVTLRNTAPADLPDNGYLGKPDEAGVGGTRLMSSLYSALDIESVTVNGEPVDPNRSTERGYAVADAWHTIPPGGEAVLRYRLAGTVPLPGGRYQLDVHRQPTVAPDDLRVRVNGRTIFDGPHDRDLVLEARV